MECNVHKLLEEANKRPNKSIHESFIQKSSNNWFNVDQHYPRTNYIK